MAASLTNATDDTSASKQIYERAAKKKGKVPFRLAMADYFHAPEIRDVDLTGYHGKAGDILTIKARNDIEVNRVTVLIADGKGNELERGEATQKNILEWTYNRQADSAHLTCRRGLWTASLTASLAATADIPTEDVTILVTANDLAGNQDEMSLETHLDLAVEAAA